jgi:hypothetical protein
MALNTEGQWPIV